MNLLMHVNVVGWNFTPIYEFKRNTVEVESAVLSITSVTNKVSIIIAYMDYNNNFLFFFTLFRNQKLKDPIVLLA